MPYSSYIKEEVYKKLNPAQQEIGDYVTSLFIRHFTDFGAVIKHDFDLGMFRVRVRHKYFAKDLITLYITTEGWIRSDEHIYGDNIRVFTNYTQHKLIEKVYRKLIGVEQ